MQVNSVQDKLSSLKAYKHEIQAITVLIVSQE